MKYIYLLTALLFLFSCTEPKENTFLVKADKLKELYPDSALHILKDSLQEKKLNDKSITKYCILKGELQDKLIQKIEIDTTLLKRSIMYCKKKKRTVDEAKSLFYLGRIYAENCNYKFAISSYLSALKKASDLKEYNLSGYISSYTADLYTAQYETNKSYVYYVKAKTFFLMAGNIRSWGIALRDIGQTYFLNEKPQKALSFYFQADSVARSLNDTLFMCSMANYIGNARTELKQYELAEPYYLRYISLIPKDIVPNYTALVNLYTYQKKYDKARFYLNILATYAKDLESKVSLNYQQYQLAKRTNKTALALHYLEQQGLYLDSLNEQNETSKLYEIEKKYEKEQIINENQRLKIKSQKTTITVLILIAILIGVVYIYQLNVNRKKKRELNLILELQDQQIKLRRKEGELITMNKRMDEVKELLLTRSLTFQKIKLLSNFKIRNNQKEYAKAVKGIFGEPSLTDEDWNILKQAIDETFPSFTKKLQNEVPNLSEDEIKFCCLLRFNLSPEELLVLLNINPGSLRTKRYRINQKIGLTKTNKTLEEYFYSLK